MISSIKNVFALQYVNTIKSEIPMFLIGLFEFFPLFDNVIIAGILVKL